MPAVTLALVLFCMVRATGGGEFFIYNNGPSLHGNELPSIVGQGGTSVRLAVGCSTTKKVVIMEQVLAGGLGLILLLVGIVATVTVGVMAILLPFFVFRILSHVAEMNRKMSKVVDLLDNESKQRHRQQPAVGGQLEPTVRVHSGLAGGEEKPFRFR